MKKLLVISVVCLTVVALAGCTHPTSSDVSLKTQNLPLVATTSTSPTLEPLALESSPSAQGVTAMQDKTTPIATQATIQTDKGDIVIKLYPDSAPKTVSNFISKAEAGFYNNLNFHRVEDWVIQGGDPIGTGTGGGKMPTELSEVPFKEGSVGVARGGDIKVSNDAQFFICTTDCNFLTGQYTNFGEVLEGMDVAKQIAIGDKIKSITYQ